MYSAPVKNFNLALKNAMFEKYAELKEIKLTENYITSSQYALFKNEIKKQVDEEKLIEKFVTCFKNDEPATAFYTSWYDIEGPDEKQSFKSMRYFSGKLIKKEGFIGKGGQVRKNEFRSISQRLNQIFRGPFSNVFGTESQPPRNLSNTNEPT